MKSSTQTLIKSLEILAQEIESTDGVANAAIAEAAERLTEQESRISHFMSEIARLSNQVVDLQNERDALESKVRLLLAGKWNGDEYRALLDTQTIRDIQAEAAEKAIKAVLELPTFAGQKGHWLIKSIAWDDILPFAKKYAVKVKAGAVPQESQGTWLKDSNVNGGKRQGGE